MMQAPDPVAITDVSCLVRWLEEAGSTSESFVVPFWFRGHKQLVSTVLPGILRSDIPEVAGRVGSWREEMPGWTGAIRAWEMEFNNDFRRRAASLLPDQEDFVEIYLLAQHHGLPTRLLDWTTNPLAALFFAVSGEYGADGEVVVTVPRYAFGPDCPVWPSDLKPVDAAYPKDHPLLKQAVACLFGEGECPDEPKVFFIVPDFHSPRMIQQAACFTLHMPSGDSIPEKAIVRLPVPAERKVWLQESLRNMGASWATLFPDLDHICYEITASYGMNAAPKQD